MSYICRICDQKFQDIPPEAKQLMGSGATVLIRMPDGTVHDLRKDRTLQRHNRWHGHRKDGTFYSDPFCEICNPPEPEVPITEQSPVEPDPVAVFLDEEPIGVPIPVIEEKQSTEPEPNTAMAQAFKTMRRQQ